MSDKRVPASADKARFPAAYLAAALAASAVAVYYTYLQVNAFYVSASRTHLAHYEMLGSVNKLLELDARITMAANLAAATGDAAYRRDYERLAPELDAQIHKVNGFTPDSEGSSHTAMINEANLSLVELERRALRLAAAGRRPEAAAILAGEKYSSLKKTYARGVNGLINEFESTHLAAEAAFRRDILRRAIASAACAGVALGLWTLAVMSVASWLKTKGSAEALIAIKEEEFRHFFDTVQEIFYRADWRGHLTDITPSIYKYSGYTREELIGQPITRLYENPEERKALIKTILTAGVVEDYEVKLKTKDRGVLDVLVNARLLKGFGGVPAGVEGSLRDITVRKRAERRLGRMNRLYTILSRVNEAIVRITSRQKLFEEVCRIAVEAGGIKCAWIGMPGPDGCVRPVAYHGIGAEFAEQIRLSPDPVLPEGSSSGAVAARERRVVINSDTSVNASRESWHEAMLSQGLRSSAYFPVEDGGVMALFAGEKGFFTEDEERLLTSLAEDITFAVNSIKSGQEKREAERQLEQTRELLRQSQKMEAVGRLAGGIAHDFNNMLTAILSYAGFIKADMAAADPRLADVQEIISAAERAAGLTRQLLAFSRRQMLRPRVIGLNETVRGTEGMLRRLIGEHIDFSLRLDENAGNIKADPGQIEQVLMNLVVNARDAIAGGGRIIVETAAVSFEEDTPGRHDVVPPGRYARMVISDTGSGMDAEVLSHMFEPFFTTKGQGKGTGLGLSTVYGVVKQSGGYVWVYSEPGKGTSFKIYFPQAAGAAGALPAPPAPAAKGGTERLLLVEDDQPIRAAMARILREAGYTVAEAGNGEDALALGRPQLAGFSLLVTDLMMPRMGGMELAAAVRAAAPGLPVLYISGYSEELVAASEKIGADSWFLQKPVGREVLLGKVREALDAAPAKK